MMALIGHACRRACWLVAALSLAGCLKDEGKTDGPMIPPHPAARPQTVSAPSVDATGGGYAFHGLPAVAAGGQLIAVVAGAPPNRIEIRTAEDTINTTLALSPATIAEVNRQLATLHGIHDLRPMQPLAVEPPHDGEDAHWATGDNLDVEWRDHRLNVYRHNATNPVGGVNGASWAGAHPGCRPYLAAVHHTAPGPAILPSAANTVVIALGFHGDASCEATEPQVHVVNWVGEK